MSDLNEWKLEYPGVAFNFGTLASDYPFVAQVDVAADEAEVQDLPHPNSDGLVMGRDSLRGQTLTFNLTTIPDFQGDVEPWNDALDLVSVFRSKWRADTLRRTPGAYATLTNINRSRLVYGRPRKFTPKFDRLRKGLIGYIATFDAITPDWYDLNQKVTNIFPVPSGAGGGIKTPIKSPISTTPGTEEVSAVIRNDGDIPAYPIIAFDGPGSGYSLELLQGVNVLWKIQVPNVIRYDQILNADTRPWARGAVVNGAPANGWLRGDQLEKCTIPPGVNCTYRFKVKDPSGQANAAIRWRDTYASM